jgi:hypothetical protein
MPDRKKINFIIDDNTKCIKKPNILRFFRLTPPIFHDIIVLIVIIEVVDVLIRGSFVKKKIEKFS